MRQGSQDVGLGGDVPLGSVALWWIRGVWTDHHAWIWVFEFSDDSVADADGGDLYCRAVDCDLGDEPNQVAIPCCGGRRVVPDCGRGWVVACPEGKIDGVVGLLLCRNDIGDVESAGAQVRSVSTRSRSAADDLRAVAGEI